jgi:hypothetical protein
MVLDTPIATLSPTSPQMYHFQHTQAREPVFHELD